MVTFLTPHVCLFIFHIIVPSIQISIYEILKQLGNDGRLIAIDRDPQAIASVPTSLTEDPRFELVKGEIAQMETIIGERNLVENVDGILFDLGVSSPQLDEADRGFSFMRDGPLDMRMDPDSGTSASDWLAAVEERELKQVLRKYGEENNAGRIARAIVAARKESPITRTAQLARIVHQGRGAFKEQRLGLLPGRWGRVKIECFCGRNNCQHGCLPGCVRKGRAF